MGRESVGVGRRVQAGDAVNDVSSEDQKSPRAILRCDLCHVKNGAVGGRTSDFRFHPVYAGEDPTNFRALPYLGRRHWCGRNGPEHLLRIIRIVCTPVEVDGLKMNLCQRCDAEMRREVAA